MTKNIVICCDGTNNQFGICNTNVVRIAQLVDGDLTRQICYYDPGVGTLPEQGWATRIGQTFSRWRALAFATDLFDKVSVAYAHLMEVWEPGDKVFIFGFSRGAYTARVLAAVLHALGLLPKGNAALLPYVMRLYGSLRQDSSKDYWHVLNSFRQTFARSIAGQKDTHFPIHFLGLWDTVSSVGWVWDPPAYPYTAKNPSVHTVRHAIAIDERRWFFRQNRIAPAPGQDVQEIWFAGVHSDVGGGYPEADGGLWRVTFEWMLAEAVASGLLVDETRLARVRTRSAAPATSCTERRHESLEGVWWIGEAVPKLVYHGDTKRRVPEIGLGRRRSILPGELLHGSVIERIRADAYEPGNLSPEFLKAAKALTAVPPSYPYQP